MTFAFLFSFLVVFKGIPIVIDWLVDEFESNRTDRERVGDVEATSPFDADQERTMEATDSHS